MAFKHIFDLATQLGHLVSGSNLEVVEGFLRSIRSPTSVLPFISWINCNNDDDVGHMLLRFPKQLHGDPNRNFLFQIEIAEDLHMHS